MAGLKGLYGKGRTSRIDAAVEAAQMAPKRKTTKKKVAVKKKKSRK